VSESDQPIVSFVMPIRNGMPFLDEALRSVFEQTLDDFELIVVDDGSTDATPDVLARQRDERLRVLDGAGAGLVAALTHALSEARGAYVARMDADDVSEPQRLERQVELLDRNPRVGMVASWTSIIDADGRELRREPLPTRHQDLLRRLLLRNPFAHGSVVLRRAALDEATGYRVDYGANEDYDLWRRLGRRWELACVPERLYRYRVHADGVTATDPDRTRLREQLRDEIWSEYAGSLRDIRETVRAGRRYRDLNERLFRDHLADQRALAREAWRRRHPLFCARALAAAMALGSGRYGGRSWSPSARVA